MNHVLSKLIKETNLEIWFFTNVFANAKSINHQSPEIDSYNNSPANIYFPYEPHGMPV